jgi:hypothetical protein
MVLETGTAAWLAFLILLAAGGAHGTWASPTTPAVGATPVRPAAGAAAGPVLVVLSDSLSGE